MEKTIVAFSSTQDAVLAVLVIKRAVLGTAISQKRAVVIIDECRDLISAGQALITAKIPFTRIDE